MIMVLTRLQIADNCGARVAQCIKLLTGSHPQFSGAGKTLMMVIKRSDPLKKKVKVGSIGRGLIVRTCFSFFRGFGVWLTFNQNAVVVVNKRFAPYGRRLRGPFLKEICLKYNFLGTVTRFIV